MEKNVLKNKKGFTLIELVTVIAILLILMAIAMPSIASLLGRTNEKIDTEKQKAFIAAAREYVSDNYNSISNSCGITLKTLHDNGYLSDKSYKDGDGNPYLGYVKYEYVNGQKDEFKYETGTPSPEC